MIKVYTVAKSALRNFEKVQDKYRKANLKYWNTFFNNVDTLAFFYEDFSRYITMNCDGEMDVTLLIDDEDFGSFVYDEYFKKILS